MKEKFRLSKKTMAILAAIVTVPVIAVAVSVPVTLLVPKNQAPAPAADTAPVVTPSEPTVPVVDEKAYRAAFLAQYPGSLSGTVLRTGRFSLYGYLPGKSLPSSFALPASVEEIEPLAFAYAKLPEGFTLPEATLIINHGAFAMSTLPASFKLPSKISELQTLTFAGVKFADGFALPSTLVHLGVNGDELDEYWNSYLSPFAFASFGSGFTLPNGLIDLADDTFSGESVEYYIKRLSDSYADLYRPLVQFKDRVSTVPVGFKIPAKTKIWTRFGDTWSYGPENKLKVAIPDNCEWDNPNGAVAGASVRYKT